MSGAGDLLAAYDADVRSTFAKRLPGGWVGSQDGPLTRCLTPQGGFAMAATSLADHRRRARGTGRADLRVLRRARTAASSGRPRARPPRPRPLLRRARARAGGARGAGDRQRPATWRPRLCPRAGDAVGDHRADLERVAALERAVWGEDWGWLADELPTASRPARTGRGVGGGGRRPGGQRGLADPARGHPLRRALGRQHARRLPGSGYLPRVGPARPDGVAVGYSMLQVDASDDSRPVLERLGLRVSRYDAVRVDATGAA